MASEMTDLVENGFTALGESGVEAMLSYVHPDFQMETLPQIAAEPQVYRGHDGIRRWFASFYEVMDEISIDTTSCEQIGPDRVLIAFSMRARGQSSGIEVDQEARAIATIRDDLMISLEFLLPDQEP
ncbi:MAG: nuclear transport factor 2 family protein [bacterium]